MRDARVLGDRLFDRLCNLDSIDLGERQENVTERELDVEFCSGTNQCVGENSNTVRALDNVHGSRCYSIYRAGQGRVG